MRNNRSVRVWTKSIALVALSLGGLTQFGMAKWKSVSADGSTYVSTDSVLIPALSPASKPEPRPTVAAALAAAPTTSTISSAATSTPAQPQSIATQSGPIRALVTQAVSDNDLTTLTGNTHPYARAEFDQGTAPLDLPMNRMLMVLKRSPEQDAALSKLMDDQQDKSSPNYHQWLTPQQFGQQFGPAESDTQAVTVWLALHGFQIARITNGRTIIEFSGTAAQVQEAFHTEIHKFVVNGEEHWANISDPQIPSALAPAVHGLLSLHNFSKKSFHKIAGEFMRSKVTGAVSPVTSPEGDASATNSLTPQFTAGSIFPMGPSDFATIYNVQTLWNAGIDGTGQTIAIVGQTNINLNDIAQFRSMFGLPVNPPVVILDGPDPGLLKNADEPEADLDVEWSGAVAKNATIKFVTSASTTTTGGVDLSALYIIDNNLAPVMSESYGECEYFLGNGGNTFYRLLWQQAAAQGITAMLSSGDSGSAVCDQDFLTSATFGITVSGLSSTPYNVSVGGTDFDDVGTTSTYWNPTNTPVTNNSAKSYIPEVPWNNTCAQNGLTGCVGGVASNGRDTVAGSGGRSNCVTQTGSPSINGACVGGIGYAKPSWQTGLGVPVDGVRDVPDISLFASNSFHGTGYVVCESDRITGASCDLNSPFQHFLIFGGTSASSPAFAGIMALVNQKVTSLSNPNPRQGNANPVLYALAAQANARCDSSLPATITNTACVFYDVTKGNISVACIPNFAPSSCSSATNNVPGVMIDPTNPSTEAFTTTAGYDLATGLGTVNAFNLANNWNSVTFTPSSATLTLNGSTSALTITHGASVTMAGAVTPGTATGNISLISDATVSAGIDGATLASGAYSKLTKILPGGTYNVHTHYTGDGVVGASDSATVHVTVSPENSLGGLYFVTFNSQGQPVFSPATGSGGYGAKALLHLLVTNSAGVLCDPNPEGEFGCATGTVSVTDNGTALANAQSLPLNSFGAVDTPVIVLTGGVHTLQSSYSGDASFNSNVQTNTVTISKALTSVISVASSPTIAQGASETLTATISSQSTTVANSSQEPNGTVQFVVSGNPIGAPVAVTPGATLGLASGTAQLITTALPVGADNVAATYSGDGNYSNSTSSPIVVTVTGSGADLTIAKTHAGSFTQGQVGAAYSITVTNSGSGSTAGTVIVVDTLPAGLTATAITGTGWACTLGTLTCTRADVLAAAGVYPAITVTVTVANNAPATLTNTAVVSGGGEVVTTNDTATNPTTITQLADMTIAKSHAGNFVQGQVGATYTIVATNSGLGVSAGTVSVVDVLPIGLTATAMTGTGWTCTVGTLTCTRADSLAATTSYSPITLTVTVAANAPASITNSATVSGGGELIVANDSASDVTTVLTPAAASLSVNTLAFTNQGVNTTSTAKSITVTNTGGATLTFTAAPTITSTNAANFAVAAGTTCTSGATVAGGATCIVNVTFTPPSTGSFGPATLTLTDNASPTTQTATLTGTGIDFVVTAPTSTASVTSGQTATYTITATPGTGGFANAITFSVSGLPNAATATFNPPSVTPGSSAANTTLSISTTAHGALPPSNQQRPWNVTQFALWSFALASILLGFILFGKTGRARRLTPALFVTVALLLAIGIAGCGSNTPAPTGTPAGTSTITVTATSGTLVHTTTVTLTVQ